MSVGTTSEKRKRSDEKNGLFIQLGFRLRRRACPSSAGEGTTGPFLSRADCHTLASQQSLRAPRYSPIAAFDFGHSGPESSW